MILMFLLLILNRLVVAFIQALMKEMFEQYDFAWSNIISMTNGIIGVSILAMPYCFSKSGIVLGIVTLALSGIMTSYSCKLLIKAAVIQRSRTLEFLSFRTLGRNGKLLMEICIILLLFGTLVTYQETLGDTGPSFLAKLFEVNHSRIPRTLVMVLFTVFVALPLSLSRKLDRLSHLSAFSIGFYYFFSLYLIWLAFDRLGTSSDFSHHIKLWDMSGLLEIIPIFSISFSCQTVLFVVYDELPEGHRNSIFKIIDLSVFVVFMAYLLVGVFGYIAFYDVSIHGNVIINIPETNFTELIFLGFLVCVLSGYPFMVFPCRTSINTLLFSSRNREEILESDLLLPDYRFNNITYLIVLLTTLTALLIPNMEFVLGFTGATTGSLICYVFPALLYIYSMPKQDKGPTFVHFFLCFGIVIFVMCSFVCVNNELKLASEASLAHFTRADDFDEIKRPLIDPEVERMLIANMTKSLENLANADDSLVKRKSLTDLLNESGVKMAEKAEPVKKVEESRVEPPNPREVVEDNVVKEEVQVVKEEVQSRLPRDTEVLSDKKAPTEPTSKPSSSELASKLTADIKKENVF